MPFGTVTLIPGINVERTPTLLQAGYSASAFGRFRDGLFQKLGGWQKYFQSAIPGIPRDLHAWQDLNQTNHLGVGSTTQYGVITSGSLTTITPQTATSDFIPNITVANGTATVSITDSVTSNATIYDSVYFNTPISVGGIVLSGLYPIILSTGANSFNISASAASANASTVVTNGTSASGTATLRFAAVPSWVAAGMTLVDTNVTSAIPSNTQIVSSTATTVVMNKNTTGAGVSNGDTIAFTSIPVFTNTTSSPVVSVFMAAHGRSVGNTVVFPIASTTGNITISGAYTVSSVADANHFSITASTQASNAASFTMNSGLAELLYYVNLGPPAAGSGYGLGTYGSGGYGTGAAVTALTGTAISATDYTSDNWGQIVVFCPHGGGIYYWDPTGGFTNASLVSTGPIFNTGIFVSQGTQILVSYGSTITEGIGVAQDPMLVKWSDSGSFAQWAVNSTTQAGSYRIPIGSMIVGGMPMSLKNLLWTDLDLWGMSYVGPPLVYGFDKIAAGAGLAGAHAYGQLRGNIYWMGRSNFYVMSGNGVQVLPCPVWDAVFQNLDTANISKVRAAPNTPFNEMWWFYPSTSGGTGENDSYVKVNITEPGQPWDYGPLGRSCWIDQSVLGNPIGASPSNAIVYQHETTNDADGAALIPSFTTGYFYIAEGEEFAVIDQIIPDMKFATFAGTVEATVQISFNVINYPGDTPITYGPYAFTNTTQYILTRFRGRQMSVTITSTDTNTFWRIGRIRYRYAPDGRR